MLRQEGHYTSTEQLCYNLDGPTCNNHVTSSVLTASCVHVRVAMQCTCVYLLRVGRFLGAHLLSPVDMTIRLREKLLQIHFQIRHYIYAEEVGHD